MVARNEPRGGFHPQGKGRVTVLESPVRRKDSLPGLAEFVKIPSTEASRRRARHSLEEFWRRPLKFAPNPVREATDLSVEFPLASPRNWSFSESMMCPSRASRSRRRTGPASGGCRSRYSRSPLSILPSSKGIASEKGRRRSAADVRGGIAPIAGGRPGERGAEATRRDYLDGLPARAR